MVTVTKHFLFAKVVINIIWIWMPLLLCDLEWFLSNSADLPFLSTRCCWLDLGMVEMVLIVFINPKYGPSGQHLHGAQLRGFKTRVKLRQSYNNPSLTSNVRHYKRTEDCIEVTQLWQHDTQVRHLARVFLEPILATRLWPRVRR